MYAELKQIVCEDCGFSKPVRFHKTAKKCRDCARSIWKKTKAFHRAEKRKSFPEQAHKKDFGYDLMKNYGLSLDAYKTMWESQKGCCDCCGIHESKFKRKLHIDHDHVTGQVRGQVRGLLCTRCNPGIGYFEDSVDKLEMAIAYLKKFKK
jgi:hypothetical protein